ADPVERATHGIDGLRTVRKQQQQSGGRKRQRNDTEEDPCPRPAIEQPPLQSRSDCRGSNGRRREENGLKDRLAGSREAKKNQRLAGDKQGTSAESLYDAERDQQIQPSRDSSNGAGRAHDQG